MSKLFDDDLGDDFLSSWKPTKATPNQGLEVDDVQPIKSKRKQFTSPKLDIDFDFEATFKLPAFDIDMSGLDFSSPPSPPNKSKSSERKKGIADKIDFSLDFKRFDNLDLEDSFKKGFASPEPSAQSIAKVTSQSVSETVQPIPETKSGKIEPFLSNTVERELQQDKAQEVCQEMSSEATDIVLISKENSKISVPNQAIASTKHPLSVEMDVTLETRVTTEVLERSVTENFSPYFSKSCEDHSPESWHSSPRRNKEDSGPVTRLETLTNEAYPKQVEVEVEAEPTRAVSAEDVEPQSKSMNIRNSGRSEEEKLTKTQQEPDEVTSLKNLCSAPIKEQQKVSPERGCCAPAEEQKPLVMNEVEPQQNSRAIEVQDPEFAKPNDKLVADTGLRHITSASVLPEQTNEEIESANLKVSKDIQDLQFGLDFSKMGREYPLFATDGVETEKAELATRPQVNPPVHDGNIVEEEQVLANPKDGTAAVTIAATESSDGEKLKNPLQASLLASKIQQHRSSTNLLAKSKTMPPKTDVKGSPQISNMVLLSGNFIQKEEKAVQKVMEVRTTLSKRHERLRNANTNKPPRIVRNITKPEDSEQQGDSGDTQNGKRKFADESQRRRDKKRQARDHTTTSLLPISLSNRFMQGQNLSRATTPSKTLMSSRSGETSKALAQSPGGLRSTTKLEGSTLRGRSSILLSSGHTQERKIALQGNPSPTATCLERVSPRIRAEPEKSRSPAKISEQIQSAEMSDQRTQTPVNPLIGERRRIMEQADQCTDKLEDMMKTLKKLNDDAKDLVVRALIHNNKLLILQSPVYEDKIQNLKASILEVLKPERRPVDISE